MRVTYRDVINLEETESQVPRSTKLRVIDLYSGIGGWSLGLQMAGIEMAASYEWWEQAVNTYQVNFGRPARRVDIRTLPLEEFPRSVDFVVGSPPCTHFSFANRGGNGNIAEGLKDIHKFLEVVEHVQPHFWVMENVPRVAKILERELSSGGALERFSDLVSVITAVDMTEFGLPQRRRRMLAGNFPLDLLLSYRGKEEPPTLGKVLSSLAAEPAVDPIYGITLEQAELRDNLREQNLTDEEARLNLEAKQRHPFYNVMSFPDPLDRTSRTVTALCTRVSRESIVVQSESEGLRRLTLRERAALQGFPITFQLAGRTYSDRLQMVGNAIPPLLVYYVAHSVLGISAADVKPPRELGGGIPLPSERTPESTPKGPRNSYPERRKFRAAIPNLRFGSGVRFELKNEFADQTVGWRIGFYYGTSKNILSVNLSDELFKRCIALLTPPVERYATTILRNLATRLESTDPNGIQNAWTHRSEGTHPFTVVDMLRRAADQLQEALPTRAQESIRHLVLGETGRAVGISVGPTHQAKLARTAPWILTGFLLGSWFNAHSGLAPQGAEDLPQAI